MRRAGSREQVLIWEETRRRPSTDDVWAVTLRTNRGDVETRYHPAPGATRGAVWIGGVSGGLEGPARGLYPEACRRLQREGAAGLRLHYRRPNDLPGEIETSMMTGSDEAGISATGRFEGEMAREEALQVLDPEGAETPPPDLDTEWDHRNGDDRLTVGIDGAVNHRLIE